MDQPSLSQMLDWLDEGAVLAASCRKEVRPDRIVWALLVAMFDCTHERRERSRWVMSWLDYCNRTANPKAFRAGLVSIAADLWQGKRVDQEKLAQVMGRSRSEITPMMIFRMRERAAQTIIAGLRKDHGLVPDQSGKRFVFETAP